MTAHDRPFPWDEPADDTRGGALSPVSDGFACSCAQPVPSNNAPAMAPRIFFMVSPPLIVSARTVGTESRADNSPSLSSVREAQGWAAAAADARGLSRVPAPRRPCKENPRPSRRGEERGG